MDDHFCECLRHFQAVCLCTWHNSKEPADCKLIHGTMQLTKEAKPEMSSGYISLTAELFYSDIAEAKLVIFTHVEHVSYLSSTGCRVRAKLISGSMEAD